MMKRRRFLSLCAAFACAPRFAMAGTWQGRALGADVSVALTGPRAQVDAALAAIPARLARIERLFSLYDPRSALSLLNAHGQLPDAPQDFIALLRQADTAHRQTGGLFDPSVQPLWRALADGGDTKAARALIGWHHVSVDARGSVRLAPGQQLTFNGIAQGFATDAIRDDLAEQGFTHALINIGEYAALGGPFRLGISDPAAGLVGRRTLTNSAIATSSPGALHIGDRAHILGPAGQDALWSTISIEARSATLADACSTAAVFMTQGQLAALKARAGLNRITAIDGDGDVITI